MVYSIQIYVTKLNIFKLQGYSLKKRGENADDIQKLLQKLLETHNNAFPNAQQLSQESTTTADMKMNRILREGRGGRGGQAKVDNKMKFLQKKLLSILPSWKSFPIELICSSKHLLNRLNITLKLQVTYQMTDN